MPGNVVLYPSDDYTLFTYELDQWCSNSMYFIEGYTASNKSAKILWLYLYDELMLDAFSLCKDDLMDFTIDKSDYFRILWMYISWNLVTLWSTSYVIEYTSCEDYEYPFCLEGKYYFVSKDTLYVLIARYTSWTISYDDVAISALEKEVEKWILKE